MLDKERQELLMNEFMQVPNIILQMQKVLKNGNTYACLQFIWAKTGGWGRNEDTIAYSQFANDKRYGTGLSIKTIQRSVEKLSDIGAITMKPSFNNMHEFTLNIGKIKELVGEQAKSNSPSLEDTSQVNLSVSQVNLSTSQDYLSDKPSQIDLHTRTTTQEPLHKNITQDNAPPKKEAPKAKKKSAPKPDTTAVEKPDPVSQQVWDDLLTLRKTKRAPLTQTAWNMALKEILIAQKATGHPMDQIISEWIVAGWVGFKSDWYANRAGSKPAIDRKTDKLAVNNNWENASQPTEIKSTVTFEEFMGEA